MMKPSPIASPRQLLLGREMEDVARSSPWRATWRATKALTSASFLSCIAIWR